MSFERDRRFESISLQRRVVQTIGSAWKAFSERDSEFESGFLQVRVCELSVPGQRKIAVPSSGRFAYASNTGHDSLSAANCAQRALPAADSARYCPDPTPRDDQLATVIAVCRRPRGTLHEDAILPGL